jgi:hypothetical protein
MGFAASNVSALQGGIVHYASFIRNTNETSRFQANTQTLNPQP